VYAWAASLLASLRSTRRASWLAAPCRTVPRTLRAGEWLPAGLAAHHASYDLSVQLPLLGTFKLASAQGNLANGATVLYDVADLGSGTANLYLKNTNEIWFSYSGTLPGQTQPAEIVLFTI